MNADPEAGKRWWTSKVKSLSSPRKILFSWIPSACQKDMQSSNILESKDTSNTVSTDSSHWQVVSCATAMFEEPQIVALRNVRASNKTCYMGYSKRQATHNFVNLHSLVHGIFSCKREFNSQAPAKGLSGSSSTFKDPGISTSELRDVIQCFLVWMASKCWSHQPRKRREARFRLKSVSAESRRATWEIEACSHLCLRAILVLV